MSQLKRKVRSLLNRFQFIDLATAVSKQSSHRKTWLQGYLARSVKGGAFSSYRPFRNALATIYGVQRPLDPSPPVNQWLIEHFIRKECKGRDEDMNVDAATDLFSLVRPQNYKAYDHPRQSLALSLHRKADIGIAHYVVKGEELIFQFAYPRKSRLETDITDLMMSMIYHSYAVGDFSDAQIEIADLSCPELTPAQKRERIRTERDPRIIRLNRKHLISMDEMEPHIQSIHDLLIEIGDEGISS